MKVKELIKLLEQEDQEAEAVSQEYTGGCHAIHDIDVVQFCEKGTQVHGWDLQSDTNSVNKEGKCKRNVVYIN